MAIVTLQQKPINRVRYSAGGDVTAPTVSSAAINTAGTTLTLSMSETVVIGGGGNGGLTVSASGGAATLTYASGSGSSSLVYNFSRTILQSETVTRSYTQPGNGIEDLAGNDLASFTAQAVTNNSTQTSGSNLITETFTSYSDGAVPNGGNSEVSWIGTTATTVVSFARSGGSSKSLRVQADGAQIGQFSFNLTTKAQQIYFDYWVYAPDGSESPTLGPAWLRTSAGNNKWLRIESTGTYNDPRAGGSTYTGDYVSGHANNGDIAFKPEAGLFQNGTTSEIGDPVIIWDSTTRGTWLRFRYRAKQATSSFANDGIVEFYINKADGTEIAHQLLTGNNMWGDPAGFDFGYFMGFLNAPMVNSGSYIYMTDVKISSSGWPT